MPDYTTILIQLLGRRIVVRVGIDEEPCSQISNLDRHVKRLVSSYLCGWLRCDDDGRDHVVR